MIGSRRQFLTLAGCCAMLAGCSSQQGATSRRARYRSRPDLDPPQITIRRRAGGTSAGSILITPDGPLVLDGEGYPVWINQVSNAATTNLQVQQYRGEPVLSLWQGKVTKYGIGQGHGIVVDSQCRQIATVKAAAGLSADLHELVLTDRGTAYITASRLIKADLRSVGGSRRGELVDMWIQELEIKSGELHFAWRAIDHIAWDESHVTPSSSNTFDPVHLSSTQVLGDGNLLLSARNTWALYEVERATRKFLWRLGGKRSDFALDRDAVFAWQHDARLAADGAISLFDDEASPTERSESRGLILAVEWSSHHVGVRRQFLHRLGPLLAGSQGSMQRLPGGDIFVGSGAEPSFTQFQPDGKIVLDGHFSRGVSYRAFRSPWRGSPSGPPAVAFADDGREPLVFVSWNSSTENTHWRVRGGASSATLQTLAIEPRISRSPHHHVLVVDALSSDGSVLATSPRLHLSGST